MGPGSGAAVGEQGEVYRGPAAPQISLLDCLRFTPSLAASGTVGEALRPGLGARGARLPTGWGSRTRGHGLPVVCRETVWLAGRGWQSAGKEGEGNLGLQRGAGERESSLQGCGAGARALGDEWTEGQEEARDDSL